MANANTFATFLESTKSLGEANVGRVEVPANRDGASAVVRNPGYQGIDRASIIRTVGRDAVPVGELARRLNIEPPDLIDAMLQAQTDGIVTLDISDDQPTVRLTPLGRGFLG